MSYLIYSNLDYHMVALQKELFVNSDSRLEIYEG
jgi:hypothetical protein